MRKLSTMLALGLAMVMTLGMTVSAAGSPTADSSAVTEALGSTITEATANVEGVSVNADYAISEESYNLAVVEAEKLDGYDSAEIVAAADVVVEGANGKEVTVTLAVSVVEADKEYVALHEYAPGKWEVLPVTVLADGKISITSSNWSPIVLVEVEEEDDNDDKEDDKKEDAAVVASPKTGEAMPLAGVMAVICLAGVAVCAKKVRD